MKSYKILTLFISFCIIFTTIVTAENKSNIYNEASDDCYLIENVPYVGVETGFDCEYASLSMILKYIGYNYTYHDLFFLTGAAYTLASRPKISTLYKWPNTAPFARKPYIFEGSLVSLWEQDLTFLGDLLGFTYNLTYTSKVVDEEKEWNNYWSRCKEYIDQDKPVWTPVDVLAIPWHLQHFPSTQEMLDTIGMPSPAAHTIVLVGYNESNQTVCYHDMVNSNYSKLEIAKPGDYVGEENLTCEYIWMDLSDLKAGVTTTKKGTNQASLYYWDDKFCITLVLEKTSEPLSKSEVFNESRARGINKMKGWDRKYYDLEYKEFYSKFGIDALKAFKNDIKTIKILPKLVLWRTINKIIPSYTPFPWTAKGIMYTAKDKEFAADSLLKNQNISDFCKHDSELLYNESLKWKEIYYLFKDFEESFYNDTLPENLKVSKQIFEEISVIVNEIILIQDEILNY